MSRHVQRQQPWVLTLGSLRLARAETAVVGVNAGSDALGVDKQQLATTV